LIPRRFPIILGIILLTHLPAQPEEHHGTSPGADGMKTLSSVHFDIIYPDGQDELAIRTAVLAESGYLRVSNYLQHEMTSIIPVIIYPSEGRPDVCRFIHSQSGPIGPYGGTHPVNAIAARFAGSYAEYYRLLTHKIVHAFQLSIIGNDGLILPKFSSLRLPLWMGEGMAEYIACGFGSLPRMVMRDLMMRKRHRGIMELTDRGSFDASLCSREGQAFFYFIETRYGRELFGEMIKDFRDLGFIEDVVHAGTGKNADQLDAEWFEFLGKELHLSENKPEVLPASRNVARENISLLPPVPAVSPDGGRIAYLADIDGTPLLHVVRTGDGGGNHGVSPRQNMDRLTISGYHPEGYQAAWTFDRNRIVLVGNKNGRKNLIFADMVTGRVISNFELPFRTVLFPSVSCAGGAIAFTGIAASAEDVYIYTPGDNTIRRITDDAFSDRNPVLFPDGKSVVFASNWNREGDIFRNTYALYRIDLNTGARTLLAGGDGSNSFQADISPDGRRMLYISDRSGSENIWLYDFVRNRSERITDYASGAFNPRWFPDGKRYACAVYRDNGYDLCVNDIGTRRFTGDDSSTRASMNDAYPDSYVSPKGFEFSEYGGGIAPEYLKITADGTARSGSSVFAQLSLNDILSRHRLVVTSNYMRESGKDDVNAGMSYYYRNDPWRIGLAVFRQASPLPAGSFLSEIGPADDLSAGIHTTGYYGGSISASYRFCRFLAFTVMAEAGGYRKHFNEFELRNDYSAGLGNISFSLEYNDLVRGAMVPLKGIQGRIMAGPTVDLIHGRTITGISIDLKYYANPFKQCIIALRGSGGTLIGDHRGEIDYRLGGFATLRGYDLLALHGRNMFLLNAELWLTCFDWRTFGMSLYSGAGNIGLVLFMDAGSAWNGGFSITDNKTGRFNDFKMDFGFGFRAAISPVLILKLDFAWPFDKKSFKQNEILYSIGFNY
jgi:Tol biopolymer transport system component